MSQFKTLSRAIFNEILSLTFVFMGMSQFNKFITNTHVERNTVFIVWFISVIYVSRLVKNIFNRKNYLFTSLCT